MAFTLKLYWITEDPRKLDKALIDSGADSNLIGSYSSVNFKSGHDLIHLTFSLRITSIYRPTDRVNYVKVEKSTTGVPRPWDMERYYFVDSTDIDPSGMVTYKCHLDPLMTYNAQLKALNCTLDRSETIFNGYLPDGEYNALGYRSIGLKMFPNGLTDDSFILITTG